MNFVIAKTNIQEYFGKKREGYNYILDYIEKEDNLEENYRDLIKYINNEKIFSNRGEFKLFICLISTIANNHHRGSNFFFKIEKIIVVMKDEMKRYFSNLEIFDFFKKNKRVLLFLIKENIIFIDQLIFSSITNRQYCKKNYFKYFFPEIKKFIKNIDVIRHIENNMSSNFEEKRKNGENDNFICDMIRKDSIEEFITYVKKTNLDLNSIIEKSIFETNSLLLKNDPTIIEYAAFFGSIQIFRYLYKNKVELTPSLWLYIVHSQNEEMISILEENHVEPDDKSYHLYLKESIKCHHHESTLFIEKNYLKDDDNEIHFEDNIISYCLHYYNYYFLPKEIENKFVFYYYCQFGYYELVNYYLDEKQVNLNETIVLSIQFFFEYSFK